MEQLGDYVSTSEALNKAGKRISVYRDISITELGNTNSVKAVYNIYEDDTERVGSIIVTISNKLDPDEVEMMYSLKPEAQNRGNTSIGVKEVLKDLFLTGALDGFSIRNGGTKSYIQKVILDIEPSNVASQKVALNNSFVNEKADIYSITREAFCELYGKSR